MSALDREQNAREFDEVNAAAVDIHTRWQLAQVRKQNGLTIEQVAERMGYNPDDVVREFESVNSDPTLSGFRRYAFSVGALVRRDVLDRIPEPGEVADHE